MTAIPDNFLGLDAPHGTLHGARVLVLPIPLEATVSYGAGTANGPAAIIAASQQVEFYDREHGREPVFDYGIHTLDAMQLSEDPGTAVDQIATEVQLRAQSGKLVVGLGGEHTISAGFNRGLLDALGGPITVVQIDAHCDLRDVYDGSRYSHACVARRMLDDERVEQVLQLGIRSVDLEEAQFARTAPPDRLRIWYAEDVHAGAWHYELSHRLHGKRVHLTIDVDGLDPSIVPATGTPEPDGLTWTETLDVIRTVALAADAIAGIDCVELAPIPNLHHADFAVAKLLYKTITYAMNGG